MDWNKAIVLFLSEIPAKNDDTVIYLYFLIIVIHVTCSSRIIDIIISKILKGVKAPELNLRVSTNTSNTNFFENVKENPFRAKIMMDVL